MKMKFYCWKHYLFTNFYSHVFSKLIILLLCKYCIFVPHFKSYHVDPAIYENGAAHISFLKERKREAFQKCRADPKCPDVLLRDNEGFVECIDGKPN